MLPQPFTAESHFERIRDVKTYIRTHMDEPLDRSVLAQMAGYSVTHFHRIFRAHVGDSIGTYVRRVRLERSAVQLRQMRMSITEIALLSGYDTPSAFNKAFKQLFGITPTEFRELSPQGAIHILNRRYFEIIQERDMKPIQITELDARTVLYTSATELMETPAMNSAPQDVFGRMHHFLKSNDLMPNLRHMIAVYPDPVELGKEATIEAGAIFAEGVKPDAPEQFAYRTIPGGKWAIFLHTGPYDTLWKSWDAIYRDWLPESGERLREIPPYEDYVDDPTQVNPEELRTEIYIPLV